MISDRAIRNTQYAIRNTRSWLLIAFLVVLFLGPLVAPMFQATGLPVVADSGALAHELLSRYLCPTPAKSYTLFGFPMAVCARCWGATIGLWLAWLLLRSQAGQNQEPRTENLKSKEGSRFLVLSSQLLGIGWALHLSIAAGALLLWTLEINLWPAGPLAALIVNGANGGFWAGMFAGSLWLARGSRLSQHANAAQR